MKISLISPNLKGSHGNDLGAIKGADKLIPAYPQFAFARFDLVVLHSSGFVSHSAVNPVTVYRNRGGDIAHGAQ
ncbi:MAG: hypothetical protein WD824_10035 [Cyclobacteriaceae bacterium]